MARTHGSTNHTHGGARPGAGRKPKILQYASAGDALEQTIVDALPKVIDKIIAMALDGDLAAGRYLVDRILGRPSRLSAAPVEDRALAYTHADYERDLFMDCRKFNEYDRLKERASQPEEPYRVFGMTQEEIRAKLEERNMSPSERLGKAIRDEIKRRELNGES